MQILVIHFVLQFTCTQYLFNRIHNLTGLKVWAEPMGSLTHFQGVKTIFIILTHSFSFTLWVNCWHLSQIMAVAPTCTSSFHCPPHNKKKVSLNALDEALTILLNLTLNYFVLIFCVALNTSGAHRNTTKILVRLSGELNQLVLSWKIFTGKNHRQTGYPDLNVWQESPHK